MPMRMPRRQWRVQRPSSRAGKGWQAPEPAHAFHRASVSAAHTNRTSPHITSSMQHQKRYHAYSRDPARQPSSRISRALHIRACSPLGIMALM